MKFDSKENLSYRNYTKKLTVKKSHHYINQQIRVTLSVCLGKNMLPSMLPWHAIPFLKGLGMLTPNPWENG